MATVKCKITYPDQFITDIGEFQINFEDATETITSPGNLEVTRENVDVSAHLHVVGILFGPENATCEMDVFVDDTKVNSNPIESVYKPNMGGQLFNWFA